MEGPLPSTSSMNFLSHPATPPFALSPPIPSRPSSPTLLEDKSHFGRLRSASDVPEFHKQDTRKTDHVHHNTSMLSVQRSNNNLLSPDRLLASSSTSAIPTYYNVVESIDFYDVGNVLGEIGILRNAASQIDAVCETDVKVFFIERGKLEQLMIEHPVLEERMWKILAVHIASTLLVQTPEYQVH